MQTVLIALKGPEEKQQFYALWDNAKSVPGNLACFEFNDKFFKVTRENTDSIWKISRITHYEYIHLTSS